MAFLVTLAIGDGVESVGLVKCQPVVGGVGDSTSLPFLVRQTSFDLGNFRGDRDNFGGDFGRDRDVCGGDIGCGCQYACSSIGGKFRGKCSGNFGISDSFFEMDPKNWTGGIVKSKPEIERSVCPRNVVSIVPN